MSYQKISTNFVDHQTVLNTQHIAHIEDGIVANDGAISDTQEMIAAEHSEQNYYPQFAACLHNGKLYMKYTTGVAHGTFDPNDWQEMTIDEITAARNDVLSLSIDTLEDQLGGKISKSQGLENAGKELVVGADGLVVPGESDAVAELKSQFSSAVCGTFYVPSEYALGYLDTSGEIQPSTNRVTFGEYLKMAVPTEIVIDSGYAITLCYYDDNKSMTNRYNVSGSAYIPPNTYFRVTIRNSADSAVTDVDEWAHHCHLKWAVSGIALPLTSSDNLNDLKDTGLYSPSQNPLPTNWPVAEGQTSGAYGVLLVYKASTGGVYQFVADTANNFYVRRCTSTGTWNGWSQFAKNADVIDALKPASDQSVTSNSYTTLLPNANLATAGRTYFIAASVTSTMTANLPVYGKYGYLITFKTMTGNAHGLAQIYITKDGEMWYRGETGSSSSSWGVWFKCATTADVTTALIPTLMPASAVSVTSNSYSTVLPDANLASAGRTYFIAASVTSTMTANLPVYEKWGYLVTFNTMTGNAHALAQIYITKDGELWHRGETGSGSTYNWSAWVNTAAYADTLAAHPLAAKIFKRVGCIGDSYTEGYIKVNGGEAQHLPAYSWPHYMESLTGNTWTNFGVSGSSSKSWMSGGTYSKLSEVQASGNKCQAYVIGLMLNDSTTSSPNYVAVGTSADIGTDANSYYAYYYKLIAAVHAVNANAPIFCNTCPQTASRLTAYNQAVRDIVTYCKQHNMPVYLCDLAGSKYFTRQYYANPIFSSDSLNSHYSAIGYEMMAECYLRVLSDIVIDNVTDFQGVHLIDYDAPSN